MDSDKGRVVSKKLTICEVNRLLWDKIVIALHDNPGALIDIKPTMDMAMALGMKLIKHMIDHKIAEPGWEKNNVEEAKYLRKERVRIEKEIAERSKK
jgi:hypothetical protein